MGKIVLISCVSRKLNTPAKAKDIYTSPLFKYNLKYAYLQNPDKIFILSAKYGIIGLDEKIEPYNQTLNEFSEKQKREWADKVLSKMKKETNLKNDEFIFLAGKNYRKYLTGHMKNSTAPLERLGIGKQLKFLKDALK
jgi:cytoplasmic iron level regulating protein YaaA (DUF328/UPF0246 family)